MIAARPLPNTPKSRARLGFGPETSRTLTENQSPRPRSHPSGSGSLVRNCPHFLWVSEKGLIQVSTDRRMAGVGGSAATLALRLQGSKSQSGFWGGRSSCQWETEAISLGKLPQTLLLSPRAGPGCGVELRTGFGPRTPGAGPFSLPWDPTPPKPYTGGTPRSDPSVIFYPQAPRRASAPRSDPDGS